MQITAADGACKSLTRDRAHQALWFKASTDYMVCRHVHVHGTTICTEKITNENLLILFCFRFRNGKANKFPQIVFGIRFRNDHVGNAQATTTGHTYTDQRFSFAFAVLIQRKEIQNSGIFVFFFLLVIVSVRMVTFQYMFACLTFLPCIAFLLSAAWYGAIHKRCSSRRPH